jgi:hypothetical protein
LDVLSLILACSLHSDDALVRVMVDVQSAGNVYFVGNLATLKTRDDLTSAAAALKAADDIAGHGGRPAVGLLGVPLEWAAYFGRTPADLFDACTNIAIGTAMFSEYEAACAPPRPPSATPPTAARRTPLSLRSRRHSAALRACVLAHLANGLGLQGTPAEILKRIDVAAAEPPAPQASPIFGAAGDDARELATDWSDRRIYLDGPDGAVKGPTPAASSPPPRAPGPSGPTPAPPPSPSPSLRALRPIPILPNERPRAATAATPPAPAAPAPHR